MTSPPLGPVQTFRHVPRLRWATSSHARTVILAGVVVAVAAARDAVVRAGGAALAAATGPATSTPVARATRRSGG